MSTEPVVIVGAGHAARRAAEALRQRDAAVPILMIGEETELPYDRPSLSKEVLMDPAGEARVFVRGADWYDAQGIDLQLGVRVESIDRAARRVHLADGTSRAYGRLVIATGSRVRRFDGPVDPGVKLHYVRTLDDSRALRAELAPGRHVVVLGGGFIGLEVAAAARRQACQVTVVDTGSVLLKRALPEIVGLFARRLHETNGVAFRLEERPVRIRIDDAGRQIVETDRGALVADVIVVGIGVVPNAELAAAAGLRVNNGICVDAGCRTSDPAIYAAGEVTRHFNPVLGAHVRIESWQVAENQPAIAAANLLGENEQYAEIPWLWSDQYQCNLQLLGAFGAEQRTVVRGDANAGPFCVFGLDSQNRLVAVAAVNAGRDIGACRRLMAAGKALDPASLADPAIALRTLIGN